MYRWWIQWWPSYQQHIIKDDGDTTDENLWWAEGAGHCGDTGKFEVTLCVFLVLNFIQKILK